LSNLEVVKERERSRIAAMLRGDTEAIADYLDDDLVYIHSTGAVDDKGSYLQSLREGQFTYEAIDVIEDRHALGGDCVVLTQIVSVNIRVGSIPAQRREVVATSVWKFSRAAWKLIAMQATPRATRA
jgi:ketosteroid isomerase-like protein